MDSRTHCAALRPSPDRGGIDREAAMAMLSRLEALMRWGDLLGT